MAQLVHSWADIHSHKMFYIMCPNWHQRVYSSLFPTWNTGEGGINPVRSSPGLWTPWSCESYPLQLENRSFSKPLSTARTEAGKAHTGGEGTQSSPTLLNRLNFHHRAGTLERANSCLRDCREDIVKKTFVCTGLVCQMAWVWVRLQLTPLFRNPIWTRAGHPTIYIYTAQQVYSPGVLWGEILGGLESWAQIQDFPLLTKYFNLHSLLKKRKLGD